MALKRKGDARLAALVEGRGGKFSRDVGGGGGGGAEDHVACGAGQAAGLAVERGGVEGFGGVVLEDAEVFGVGVGVVFDFEGACCWGVERWGCGGLGSKFLVGWGDALEGFAGVVALR